MAGRLCVGVVLGAHGLKGAVRIKSFTADPADVAAYGPVEDLTGTRRFRIRVLSETKGVVTAVLDGIADRTAAEGLKGVRLHVERDRLPEAGEEEFYYSDLVGLAVERVDGTPMGKVKGVFDFGGGDVIDIDGPGGPVMVPFTRAAVPVVDIAGGRLVVDPPLLVEAAPPEEGEDEGHDAGA
ncbi:MAG: 16S rRNA processing protein RimM [Telmatospirillum sp.]|nr:16S rRNA processing protein RimM [Telmatospirillum sp.]